MGRPPLATTNAASDTGPVQFPRAAQNPECWLAAGRRCHAIVHVAPPLPFETEGASSTVFGTVVSPVCPAPCSTPVLSTRRYTISFVCGTITVSYCHTTQ